MEDHYSATGSLKPGIVYLFMILVTATTLFYLSYRYIHHLNQPPSVSLPVAQPLTTTGSLTQPNPAADRLLGIKLNRERERSRDVERIQGMLIQDELSQTIRNEAEAELWRLTQVTAKENELEQVLKTNGFQECLVALGERSVTVVVASSLDAETARIIGELAAEVTGFNPSQIRIVEQ